ncbi:MAG: cytochrome c [Myxococcota bacterium]
MWFLALVPLALGGKQPSKRPTDEERGKELYERHCHACHGAGARGDGPATKALREAVPVARNFKIDASKIDLVMQGRNLMPAFGNTFDRNDAKRVLRHMVRLPDVATEPPEAEKPAPEAEAP